MPIIVTLRLMDDGRENRAERKIAGKHPKRTLFCFFSADEGEFYATKLLIFIFFLVMSKSMGA